MGKKLFIGIGGQLGQLGYRNNMIVCYLNITIEKFERIIYPDGGGGDQFIVTRNTVILHPK